MIDARTLLASLGLGGFVADALAAMGTGPQGAWPDDDAASLDGSMGGSPSAIRCGKC